MEKNEKIVAAISAAIIVGSATFFAVARKRAAKKNAQNQIEIVEMTDEEYASIDRNPNI